MEKTMLMPAYYNVLNTEEMTYTEGGATVTQAVCAAVIPFYGWYKASVAIRDYRRAHPNTWMETGLDAVVSHMEKSVVNAIYDVACIWNFASTCALSGGLGLIPTALIVLS